MRWKCAWPDAGYRHRKTGRVRLDMPRSNNMQCTKSRGGATIVMLAGKPAGREPWCLIVIVGADALLHPGAGPDIQNGPPGF
ncbi:hypothetical protein [uncultured Methanoregula sp.]|uniref:hypothetical protein n=1 Tax=uncultured Methanoregula sp. TaxID=1005933 RepID=UPI002AAB1758|nr:hypothetical protein [uncultured Methanoregula sp.]